MKPGQIRDLSIEEVEHRLSEIDEELLNLNLRKRLQKLDNPLRLRVLRRDRARLKTILNEHKVGIRKLSASTRLLDSENPESDVKE
ncbi:MAG: 50S ribosomal protein L29 [candidate division Zixibacteria bacterium]|nr:50S ribosomal protein L29 [candidate division Zixibacteria bacterium]